MAVVVFDPEKFRSIYPAFSDETKYSNEYLQNYFDIAAEFVGNTDSTSFAPYDPDKNIFLRARLLDLVTCHLLTLESQPAGQNGRISSATQGSVSTSFDLLKANTFVGDWWAQTRCGAMYWVMTARFRIGGRIYPGNRFHPWG